MKYLNGQVLTALMMTLVFSSMVLVATQYPPNARMLPMVIGIPGTLLCFIQLGFELLASHRKIAADDVAADFSMQSDKVKKEVIFFMWFPAFIVSVLLIGFIATTLVMVFLFLRLSQREPMKLSVALSLGGAAVIYLVFEVVLTMSLFEGALIRWLFY